MKIIITLGLLCCLQSAMAQELYVYTEPASNMAAKSIGVRLTNSLLKNTGTARYHYYANPEVMFGISKKVMLHFDAFLNDGNNSRFALTGGSVYLKYRFYSVDEVHNHFRIAAFGRYSLSNSAINDHSIQLNNQNSGYEAGLVATKLRNKIAFSATASFVHALNNIDTKYLYNDKERNAVNYTLSIGKLMLPKEYTSYKQTNMNLMLELLGQTNMYTGEGSLDAAPVVQFIFNSRIRLDFGYRYPLVTNLHRDVAEGALIRFEYNFFNAFK